MEGPGPQAYVPGAMPSQTGDPQRYLEVALSEAIRAKQDANALADRRPNLLAVNLSLSADAQVALNRVDGLRLSLPDVQVGPGLDALAVATVGIDERLERSRFRRIAPAGAATVALDRLTCVGRNLTARQEHGAIGFGVE